MKQTKRRGNWGKWESNKRAISRGVFVFTVTNFEKKKSFHQKSISTNNGAQLEDTTTVTLFDGRFVHRS